MSEMQIDTRKIALQNWRMVGEAVIPMKPHSPALIKQEPITALSRSATGGGASTANRSLEDQLFDNRAELKIAFSQIVMHLPDKWRESIFRQLDARLDIDAWEDDSSLIKKTTFMTFLRFVIYVAPSRLPSLGVSPNGHILAAWNKEKQRVVIEFFPDDQASISCIRVGSRSAEVLVWRGHIVDMSLFLQRNLMAEYFKGDSV